MKITVQKAVISHETAFINGAVYIIELSAPRERWAVMGEEQGLIEPIANYEGRQEAEDAALRLKSQLADMRKKLQ